MCSRRNGQEHISSGKYATNPFVSFVFAQGIEYSKAPMKPIMIKNYALCTGQIRRDKVNKLIAPLKEHQSVFPDSPEMNDATVKVGKCQEEVIAVCLYFIYCYKVTALESINNLHCLLCHMNRALTDIQI